MRHCAPLLLLFLAACASSGRLRPFTTDGCSLFPDGTSEQKDVWLGCCERHDYSYWRGGTKAERLKADLDLRDCVAAAGEPKTAAWMLRGTRAGGTPYLPTGFRWGYGWSRLRGYRPLGTDESKQVADAAAARQTAAEEAGALETETKASSTTKSDAGPTSPDRVLRGEPTKFKNYFIPALEIPAFQLALNGADRLIYGEREYGSTLKTGWKHVREGPWVVDRDEFIVNQVGHPYQGSLYYGFARASGLNFWEGLLYSNAGSFLWETYGETTAPSINDQVASGTGGPLVGEPLFRLANRVLEGGDGPPGFWRELGAGLISPPTALNRLLFGERYTPVLKSRGAPTFTQVSAGAGANSTVRNPSGAVAVDRDMSFGRLSTAYGNPGLPGYLYLRPFDYFTLELNGLVENRAVFADMMTRGLLFGWKYEAGDSYQGVWGLYGSFDYISPQVFRFSTTAASLGTTFQWLLSRRLALQGTAAGGLGYGSAGSVALAGDERDYHYGAAPQGLLALRLILGRAAMLDASARGYHLGSTGAGRAPGREEIGRFNSSFFVRLYGPHAVGLTYLLSSREARYSGAALPARHQLVETVGIAYSLLSGPGFGVVGRERD